MKQNISPLPAVIILLMGERWGRDILFVPLNKGDYRGDLSDREKFKS